MLQTHYTIPIKTEVHSMVYGDVMSTYTLWCPNNEREHGSERYIMEVEVIWWKLYGSRLLMEVKVNEKL